MCNLPMCARLRARNSREAALKLAAHARMPHSAGVSTAVQRVRRWWCVHTLLLVGQTAAAVRTRCVSASGRFRSFWVSRAPTAVRR